MKRILCALILASSLCGCSTFWRGAIAVHDAIDDALATKTNTPAATHDPPPGTAGEDQTLWPAYSCPDFAKHGYEGEDTFRESCIAGSRAAGATAMAIRFYANEPPARIEIYEWESDKTKGKFRPNWTRKARDGAGVKRWVVDISGSSLEVVRDTFKAYAPDSDFQVQFTGISLTPEVKKILECDAQGIKTTPRRLR